MPQDKNRALEIFRSVIPYVALAPFLKFAAYDSLYQAVEQGYPAAKQLLAAAISDHTGRGHRKKRLALLKQSPGSKEESLYRLQKKAIEIEQLGESYVSTAQFRGLDKSMQKTLAPHVTACALTKEPIQFLSTQITQTLHDDAYLPSKVAGYEHLYLVEEKWQEEWKYQVCNKTMAVIIDLEADGLGLALYKATVKGK